MNQFDFLFEIPLSTLKLLDLFKDLYNIVNEFQDDVLPLQRTQNKITEDPCNLLNFSRNQIEMEYSNEFQPTEHSCNQLNFSENMKESEYSNEKPIKKRTETIKHNYIIENDQNPYQCGECYIQYQHPCQLGGHIQQKHKLKKNQQPLEGRLQPRKRQKKKKIEQLEF